MNKSTSLAEWLTEVATQLGSEDGCPWLQMVLMNPLQRSGEVNVPLEGFRDRCELLEISTMEGYAQLQEAQSDGWITRLDRSGSSVRFHLSRP